MLTAKLDRILKDHAVWLKDPTKGKRADLTGADLFGANLYGANLYGANLSSADLTHVYPSRESILAQTSQVGFAIFGGNET